MTRILTIIALLFATPILAACATPQNLLDKTPSYAGLVNSQPDFLACFESHYLQTNHLYRKVPQADGGVVLQLFMGTLFGHALASVTRVQDDGRAEIFVARSNFPYGYDGEILEPIKKCME